MQTDHKGIGDASSLQILVHIHQGQVLTIILVSITRKLQRTATHLNAIPFCGPQIFKKLANGLAASFISAREERKIEWRRHIFYFPSTLRSVLFSRMGRFLLQKFLHADVCVATIGAVKFTRGPFFDVTPTSLASGSGHLHVDIPIGENFARGYTPSIPGWGGWVSLVSLMFHLKTGPQNALSPNCSLLTPSMHQVSNHTKKRSGNWVASDLS